MGGVHLVPRYVALCWLVRSNLVPTNAILFFTIYIDLFPEMEDEIADTFEVGHVVR
jgi:hypothetical protein